MGVTIKSKNISINMGSAGFMMFRIKVAELANEELKYHYEKLFSIENKSKDFYEEWDKQTNKLIENNILTDALDNFLFQPDVGGKIDYCQVSEIYNFLQKYKGKDILYGYESRKDCAKFSDLKKLFKDASENKLEISWC